ncbi:3-isopropylmalate dehydratase small subunit [Sphingobium sufflavum]|uniref:3-isopropylmalate dehydratase small subunit n=1 Tax=Sphingobium sufflavum TaxID=1129547 RepID=UPI001F3D58D6|nr:3-isopropylmalate dehydratase small subunit [Sphingobium sufflavum]MCE7798419.1 3-isopropylmalate dehydratase small subunit [Sphingobium sufflavum]
MTPFTSLLSRAVPLIRDNIDTDAIIPSREMKSVAKAGLSDGLFAGWRYTAIGGREPNPDFVLNDPLYQGATILLGGPNFGCGSSREHAVWALAEYGFRAIVAPSFNPIFRGNCIRNGILPIEADPQPLAAVDGPLAVDLTSQTITTPDGVTTRFAMEAEPKRMLLEGLDPIDLTLELRARIRAFRDKDRGMHPWHYLDVTGNSQ